MQQPSIKRKRGAQPGHGRQGGPVPQDPAGEPRVHQVGARLTDTNLAYLKSLGKNRSDVINKLLEDHKAAHDPAI